MKYDPHNVLCISDIHEPFAHAEYFDFCREIRDRCHCGTVMFLGDLVDHHACSQYPYDPDGYSPGDEMVRAEKELQKWYKEFPVAYYCIGNHDRRPDVKAAHSQLPSRLFKPFNERWGTPKGWKIGINWIIDGVLYTHGSKYSGDTAHLKAASDNRMSTVIGHLHSQLATGYMANEVSTIFGMVCGCGIDRHRYAFEYEKENRKTPVLGNGIVTDKGRFCQVFPLLV